MEEEAHPRTYLVITDKGRRVAQKTKEIQEILENPSESFMDEYIATYGEIVERLLQPIVNKMVAEALEREREVGR